MSTRELTITAAMGEIKLSQSKLASKRADVIQYMAHLDDAKDPLRNKGGSEAHVKSLLDSIKDLEQNVIALRTAINKSNEVTNLTVSGVTKTVAEWLVFRREIMTDSHGLVKRMKLRLNQLRDMADKKTSGDNKVGVDVYVDEVDLSSKFETAFEVEQQLDSALSVSNAITLIKV